mmetsp:Transcript_93264/g.237268  ORF Transcript_93264/g.237268 Transcript_93264/m.237268 type:complete len:231 (-) Transcript_93264:175-867(-)|eukprot:CAMPEP_0183436428 /NCGR_PEP_ID=MMETSP0370-20130417/69265_1 /TAXON_ID=268820 /ORGANISM="Peridinium aciculiferum, Strain PAER-2" /LENGTH=230 /DNA_ID=CAMNT_0025623863 /DNA_START=71 /DNA_END=763 /DNA_ORIENTATION=+
MARRRRLGGVAARKGDCRLVAAVGAVAATVAVLSGLAPSFAGLQQAGAWRRPAHEDARPRRLLRSAAAEVADAAAAAAEALGAITRIPYEPEFLSNPGPRDFVSALKDASSSIKSGESPPGGEIPMIVEMGLLPQLPKTFDDFLYVFLRIIPVITFGSWGKLSYDSYVESERASEADKKRKLRRALKTDDKLMQDDKVTDLSLEKRDKKKRKPTALDEVRQLDKKDKSFY